MVGAALSTMRSSSFCKLLRPPPNAKVRPLPALPWGHRDGGLASSPPPPRRRPGPSHHTHLGRSLRSISPSSRWLSPPSKMTLAGSRYNPEQSSRSALAQARARGLPARRSVAPASGCSRSGRERAAHHAPSFFVSISNWSSSSVSTPRPWAPVSGQSSPMNWGSLSNPDNSENR